MFSNRINGMSPSITMEITATAQRLKNEGEDILSFSAGEPSFNTPKIIKDSAIDAINHGYTKYTPVPGYPDVIMAIKNKLKRENNLEYENSNIIISNGAKHSLFNITQVLIDEGDEVIIISPYWVTYPEITKYASGKPIIIKADEKSGFKITPKQLEKSITSKTKMFMLSNPSNPTGALYDKNELLELAKVLEGTKIIVVSDEIYEKLIYKKAPYTSFASVSDDAYKRTITVNGLSKSMAMTGWRFGYLATSNKDIAKNIKKLQGQSTSGINSITQKASIAGLSKDSNSYSSRFREEFKKRRDLSVSLLKDIKKISFKEPDGAFYIFINISKVSNNSIEFCKKLLQEKLVALTPGISFGKEGYVRLSFTPDAPDIKAGIKRLKEFIKTF